MKINQSSLLTLPCSHSLSLYVLCGSYILLSAAQSCLLLYKQLDFLFKLGGQSEVALSEHVPSRVWCMYVMMNHDWAKCSVFSVPTINTTQSCKTPSAEKLKQEDHEVEPPETFIYSEEEAQPEAADPTLKPAELHQEADCCDQRSTDSVFHSMLYSWCWVPVWARYICQWTCKHVKSDILISILGHILIWKLGLASNVQVFEYSSVMLVLDSEYLFILFIFLWTRLLEHNGPISL